MIKGVRESFPKRSGGFPEDSFRMLQWLEQRPENVYAIRGNHDEEFAATVKLMERMDQELELQSDLDCPRKGLVLYESLRYYMKKKGLPGGYFDLYGTIHTLLEKKGATLRDLYRWMKMIWEMPLLYELRVKERACVMVHGGMRRISETLQGPGIPLWRNFISRPERRHTCWAESLTAWWWPAIRLPLYQERCVRGLVREFFGLPAPLTSLNGCATVILYTSMRKKLFMRNWSL